MKALLALAWCLLIALAGMIVGGIFFVISLATMGKL